MGGTERVAANLCNTWVARGEQVTLIVTYSGGGAPFYPIAPAAELIYLADVVRTRRADVLTYVRRLYALRCLIAERAPDVIVSFLPNVNVAAILASAYLRIPIIICERSDPTGHAGFHVLKALRRQTYRYADMLTVQTHGLAERAKTLFPGLKAVCAVPNALPKEIASYRNLPVNQRKVLLSLGRLVPEKQLDKLVDAFAHLAPSFDDWDLHIYGEGPLRTALEKRVRDAGLQSRVLLKGATGTPWDVMAAADAFAMVSRNEGFPNALLEAMGIGLPCVVFDCPSGPREITRDGQDALLVPLNDDAALLAALRRLFGDATLRATLGRQARESVAKRFSHAKIMEQWDHLFRKVGALESER
jgi:glycosyltransferase involved in cell wall biosynthesis